MRDNIFILGGGKTAYNLYKVFEKNKIQSTLLCFKQDYALKKGIGTLIEDNILKIQNSLNTENCIITSEKIYTTQRGFLEDKFNLHYYLRDKNNLGIIAKKINTQIINEIKLDGLKFPAFIKPKQSGEQNVPFKTKLVNSKNELHSLKSYLPDCILQEYLAPNDFKQISIGGFFTGVSESLISVEQLNQYPEGVSSYVKLIKSPLIELLISNISDFLNDLGFQGFIELEFKISKINSDIYLMDINPRPWGWFYFYLSAIKNLNEVISYNNTPILNLKNIWINSPRLVMSNLKGKIVNPSVSEFIKCNICYEPYFRF